MKSIRVTAIIIIIFSVLSKFLGFFREMVLAYWFSATAISDAYLLTSDIITIFFGWLTSFSIVYTPVYANELIKRGKKEGIKYTRNILILVTILALLAIICTEIFPYKIVMIVANGLEEQGQDLVVTYLKVCVFSIIFSAASEILISYLNLNRNHIMANSVGLLLNICECVSIILAGVLEKPIIMIYGIVFGHLLRFILAYIFSYINGLNLRLCNLQRWFDDNVIDTLYLFGPIFISSMLVEINTFIDKTFASRLATGSITFLNYGAVTRRFIFGIFSVLITSMIFPKFSTAVAQKNKHLITNMLEKIINYSLLIIIPITCLACIFSKDIISFLFERGAFRTGISEVGNIFAMYCVGLIFMVINEIYSKLIYAYKDKKTPLLIGSISIVANLILDAVFIQKFGTVGLALATSLSQVVVTPIYYHRVKEHLDEHNGKSMFYSFQQILVINLGLSSVLFLILRFELVKIFENQFRILAISLFGILYGLFYLAILMGTKNKAFILFIQDFIRGKQ